MARRWNPGDRVRLTDDVGWRERRGCTATVVAPPEPGTYPDHRGLWKTDVLVLLDDDPLERQVREQGRAFVDGEARGWTCVVGVDDIVQLDEHDGTLAEGSAEQETAEA